MPYPQELHMPSLEHLDPNIMGTLFLNIVFVPDGPQGPIRRHFGNFVRLVVLSSVEYETARRSLEELINRNLEDTPIWSFLSAVNHLEVCIITLYRAFNILTTMVKNKGGLIADREVLRLLNSFKTSLQPIRNAVMHIEEEIRNGDIKEGQAHVLVVSADGRSASIGKYEINLERLGRAIERLYREAKKIAQYQYDLSQNPDDPSQGATQ
jgi:hypothetical protein